MPVSPTYPGVYIEEIPSGVRTITAVSTSVTAFVGRAPKGDADKPIFITSFADFERRFGGLSSDSPMSYAVRDFYLNGGSQAIIVRVHKDAKAAAGASKGDKVKLEAKSPGKWGSDLRFRVELVASDPKLYVVWIRNKATGAEEKFIASIDADSTRRLDRALSSSSFVAVPALVPAALPDAHDAVANAGEDPFDKGTAGSHYSELKDGADGTDVTDTEIKGTRAAKSGIYALLQLDTQLFNILCLPPPKADADIQPDTWKEAAVLCQEKRAMLLVDPPAGWTSVDSAATGAATPLVTAPASRNAALFFPRLLQVDPAAGGPAKTVVSCGAVAGIFARTDVSRGVWKAPAGMDAAITAIQGLAVTMSDLENGRLNQLGVNCLRTFPVIGSVVWGSRTLAGADLLADEYKYVPVRRTALFLEESLYRGLKWVVFEPNDEPLWAQIRLNVGAFMQDLFRQGAFQGRTPKEAYFVKCDKETTIQNDIDKGIVNIVVGFAPLKPAEFVIVKIQQMAGQVQA